MDVQATICIPIAPHHLDVAQRAIRSAEAQTQPVNVLFEIDHERKGPGYLRNVMLAQVLTPFTVFLDADDWIEPLFIERTIQTFNTAGKYVYTDWLEDGTIRQAPDKAWCAEHWHVITSLLPTEWAKATGGFDETLPAMEDTDFYMKMVTAQHCGTRLPEALFWYSNDGKRSDEFKADDTLYKTVRSEITRRYYGKVGCCGVTAELPPTGDHLDGDVLAQALWHGNRSENGRISRRIYGLKARLSYPKITWVDPRDIDAAPHLWRRIDEPTVTDAVPMNGLDALALAVKQNFEANVREYVPPQNVVPVQGVPNVANVMRLGSKRS